MGPPPMSFRLGHPGEMRFGARLDFFGREIFLARRDPPVVPGGIGDEAGPIAPELILDRLRDLRAGVHGALEERIAVTDVQPETGGRSAVALRTVAHHHIVAKEG